MGVCFSDEAHPFRLCMPAVLLYNYVSCGINRFALT